MCVWYLTTICLPKTLYLFINFVIMSGLSKFSRNVTSKNGAFVAIGLAVAWFIARKINVKHNKRLHFF